jgi:hypothetical protein
LVVFVVWRLFIMVGEGGDPNRPDLLYDFATQPFSTLVRLVQFAIQDFLNINFQAWSKTLEPEAYMLTDRTYLFSMLIGIAGAALTAFYLQKLSQRAIPLSEEENPRRWINQALVLGLVMVLLGPLPVWLTDRQTTLGLYGSRFSLAAMAGASILLVSMLTMLTSRTLYRIVVVSCLVGIAIGFHIRRANEFRWIWEEQRRFYWQLFWRAPSLEPGTAVGADGELFKFVGRNSTALAINLLYPQTAEDAGSDFWFYELSPELVRHPEEFKLGKPLEFVFRNFNYTGSTADSILISYENEAGNCLWVLSPEDVDNPELNWMLTAALPASDIGRIGSRPVQSGFPPQEVFGREPEHTWCYFFQKADLARQQGEWQEVVRLGDEAQKLDFAPINPQEWLPFIQGYAMAGDWDGASEITLRVHKLNNYLDRRLCSLWERIKSQTAIPEEKQSDYEKLRARLECGLVGFEQ